MFKRGQKKIRFYFGVGVAYNVVLPSTSMYLISQKYFHYIYSK